MTVRKRTLAGLAAFAITGGTLFLGTAAAQAAAPVVAPAVSNDPNASNGTISFYNSAGTRIYGGPLSLAGDYAVASSPTTRVGTTKATLFFFTPNSQVSDSQLWCNGGSTATSLWKPPPASTPPGVLAAQAAGGVNTPFVTVGAGDGDLAGAFAGCFNDPTVGYDHLIQVRMEDSGPGHSASVPFWAADLYVDPATNTWTQAYPAAPVLVNTSISTPTATPTSPAPAGTTSVALSSTLSAADGTHPAGTVELFNGNTDLGPAALNPTTGAITASATVAPSTSYSFTFAFTPSGNYNAATSSPLAYSVSGPAAVTTTVVSGPTTATTGTGITLTANVDSGAAEVPATAGSCQFAVNGTNVGGLVPLTATGCNYVYTPTAAGSATVTATFVPAAGQNYAGSADPVGVTVLTTAPAYAPDAQTVVVTVPNGTLVISTPYTPANPFNLGTMQLNSAGTQLTASGAFGDPNAPATADPGQNGTVTNGVTITDTRPASTGWSASAATAGFTGPGTSTIPSSGLSFTKVTPKYITGNALQAGSVTPSDIAAFAATPTKFATTTQGPGTVDITGLLGLNAATSTRPGQYTATLTFTVA